MKDINYSNTKIYKIKKINEDDGKCYIGYTTNINNFINKWNKQYTNYNKEMKQYIDENGGIENWEIVILENYSCLNRYEALERKAYWESKNIKKLNPYKPFYEGEWYKINKSK